MKVLIGSGRCYIPSTDSLSCSKPKSICTILMCQLGANSWKYRCLRMMDCLHHVTATGKVLKGLIINFVTVHTPGHRNSQAHWQAARFAFVKSTKCRIMYVLDKERSIAYFFSGNSSEKLWLLRLYTCYTRIQNPPRRKLS